MSLVSAEEGQIVIVLSLFELDQEMIYDLWSLFVLPNQFTIKKEFTS